MREAIKSAARNEVEEMSACRIVEFEGAEAIVAEDFWSYSLNSCGCKGSSTFILRVSQSQTPNQLPQPGCPVARLPGARFLMKP